MTPLPAAISLVAVALILVSTAPVEPLSADAGTASTVASTVAATSTVAGAGASTVASTVAATSTVAGAAASTPGSTHEAAGYRPPVEPAVLTREFEAPAHVWSPGHRGVDLLGSTGVEVVAPAAGVVVFAGTVVDRQIVTVLHGDGLRSSLEPVDPHVTVGTRLSAGDVIGTLEASGSHCAPQACLHWGVRRGEVYVDPLGLLPGAGPVVLLPVP